MYCFQSSTHSECSCSDFHGAWDGVTGVNAPLYPQGYGNEEFNIHRCVENYVARGVARDKINIGLPFYGRSFKNANALNQEHGGNDLANWPEDDGTPQWFNIYNKLPHMTQMRDNKSKTQYAYISPAEQPPGSVAQTLPEGLVSFDDERAICDKVHYAQEKNLAGFIIWELSGDVLDDLSTPLLDITNRKLGDPSLQCCLLHSEEECEKERLERESASHAQMGGFDSSMWGQQQTMASGAWRMTGAGVALIISAGLSIFAIVF
jgi:chitinase